MSYTPIVANCATLDNELVNYILKEFAMSNAVTKIPAAPSAEALAHFEAEFTHETDCWDVHEAMQSADPGFILVDARSPALYAAGHLPGAVNIPHGKIIASRMSAYPDDTLFVTYCAGPHCNGAARAALRFAQLGRPVKLMAGGVTGWLDEGFELTTAETKTLQVA
ncbi:rhodanese-like domain-containing protein [Rhodanobacter sp. K2T2]|uniref:rhodanese-like domain-containing protein n=1 Tax=Rhodanobacter sp. K2T2 TaxID=2723085 RepID=UPI0021085970|nr:rhodanese-like domain-containing protein [Rhodanobacter sp. K2T2]